MQEQVVVITADGQIRFVWDDSLAGLCEHGRPMIARAGEVEPTAEGCWTVDCSRVGGGVYGPYPLRQNALEHERAVVTGRLVAGLI